MVGREDYFDSPVSKSRPRSRARERRSKPNPIVATAMQANGKLDPPAQQSGQNFAGTQPDRGSGTSLGE